MSVELEPKLTVWLFFIASLLAFFAAVVAYARRGEFELGLVAAGVFMAAMGEYYRRKGSERTPGPRD